MAKVYGSLKRGRVGSSVFRKGQNGTVESQYQPTVKNPKTVRQSFVRAAFATASAAQSGLLTIVNHSFESKKSKLANLQRFFKVNQKRILGQIMASYKTGDDLPGWLNLKGVSGIQPYAYIVSEGSVPFIPVQQIATATVDNVAISGMLLGHKDVGEFTGNISTQEQYAEKLAMLGLAPGDELAFVAIYHTDSIIGSFESSVGTINDKASFVLASRVTFVSELPESFSGPLIDDDHFNDALILRKEGNMLIGLGTTDTEDLTDIIIYDGRAESDVTLNAGVLIRSQVDINGNYRYSNGIMAFSGEADDSYYATESYLPNAAVSDGSDKFLDNPALPN